MKTFTYPSPARLHAGVLIAQIRATFPDAFALTISAGQVSVSFPDESGATSGAVAVIVAAHDPPLTTAEEQIAAAQEKADAKAAFEAALAGLTKSKVDALADGVTNVATAREAVRKIGYTVLYLLKREGIK